MAKNSSEKKNSKRVEMTLWNVVLSFPDLHDPKPFKGKVYFRTDCLIDSDDPQIGKFKSMIKQVRVSNWGEDSSEWPEKAKKRFLQDGNTREDQKPYQDKFFVSPSTQTPVPVVDMKGKPFNAQAVKGGMTANVAICISPWENDGEEGMSVYLQGIQIDTTKERLEGFGGGRSVKDMFKKNSEDSDDGEEQQADDEEDAPRSKKKAKPSHDDEEDDAPPKKKKKVTWDEDGDEDEDDAPKKKKGKPSWNDDEEE